MIVRRPMRAGLAWLLFMIAALLLPMTPAGATGAVLTTAAWAPLSQCKALPLARPLPEAGCSASGEASDPARHKRRPRTAAAPMPTIEAHVRPGFARRMERLRPAILAAARRHNRPTLSGLSDAEFATAIAIILYNENFGWLEDDLPPLQAITPLYQDLQREVNCSPLGSDLTVWPANLRPSVALEILRQEVPLPGNQVAYVPIRVDGSRIDPAAYHDQARLFAAITAEISRDDLAVAYLAANLERGLYRAAYEGAPVSWRTLAAWHNQGVVDPQATRANPTARDYLRRASAYVPLARALVAGWGLGLRGQELGLRRQ